MIDANGSGTLDQAGERPAPRDDGNGVGGRVDSGEPDAVIDGLAARQHGIVGRRQLLDAGVPRHVIDYRVLKRRLRPTYRGIYRVGPVSARHSREMAAVLACGDRAVLSHRSAAALWELLPYRAPDTADGAVRRGVVDVTVRRGCPAPGPGVRVHRITTLAPGDVTRLHGIPITAPARTVLDVAASCAPRELERVVARAERSGLATGADLDALVARFPGRRGTRQLRALLDREAGPAFTRSEAESRLLALVRKARLEAPETNVAINGYEVDCLWPRARLIVEIDGFAFHSSRAAFERDRQRDAALIAAGFRVIRVTWRQLSDEPEALLARLAQALARPRGG